MNLLQSDEKDFVCEEEGLSYISSETRNAAAEAAKELVEHVLCTAKSRLESDPQNIFFYKKPFPDVFNTGGEQQIIPTDPGFTPGKISAVDRSVAVSAISLRSDNQPKVEWCTIQEFDALSIPTLITEFVETWKLSPNTKYYIEFKNQPIVESNKGTYYDCWFYFHKPTEYCPNPLARAKVNFRVTVPIFLPGYYEIMATYRFEGFNTLFYALGDKALNSTKFQRFYIDTILEMKLAFYMEVFNCTHPDDCPICKPLFRRTCHDE